MVSPCVYYNPTKGRCQVTDKNFYQVHTKAVDELEQAIAAELKQEDPDEEVAKAVLLKATDSEPDSEAN